MSPEFEFSKKDFIYSAHHFVPPETVDHRVREEDARARDRLIQDEIEESNSRWWGLSIVEIVESMLENLWLKQTRASMEYIASFRLREKRNPSIIDETMTNERCPICQQKLKLNRKYSVWPCPSNHPYKFHTECVLDLLRTDIKCPICRRPTRFA